MKHMLQKWKTIWHEIDPNEAIGLLFIGVTAMFFIFFWIVILSNIIK